MSCSCSSVYASICWSVPHPVQFLCLWPKWQFHCLSSWLQSLSGYTLFPYFHVPSPFLDCRKLGGVSKLLPQVCVILRCVENILLLSTPHWGPRDASRLPLSHLPRHRYFHALTMLGEEDSGILKPPWALSGDAPQVSSTPVPHTTWEELEKDPELFLRNPPVSKPSSFLWIFSLHLPVHVNFIYFQRWHLQIFQTVHAQRAPGFGFVIFKNLSCCNSSSPR